MDPVVEVVGEAVTVIMTPVDPEEDLAAEDVEAALVVEMAGITMMITKTTLAIDEVNLY